MRDLAWWGFKMTFDHESDYDRFDKERNDPWREPAREVATRPRVWTVFAAFGLAVFAILGLQLVLGVVLAVWLLATGVGMERLEQEALGLVTEPAVFLGSFALTMAVVAASAIVPALLSREPTLSRLGLTTPALPIWGYPFLMLGSGVAVALGLGLYQALALVTKPDDSLEIFYTKITWPIVGPFLLLISLGPGFMEELLCRGYIQRRLLARWSPWLAILVSSSLFAVLHLLPHTILFAFPAGIWLGVIAWRTGSVWPGIVCHVFVNASICAHEVGIRLLGWPEVPPLIGCIALGVAITGGFTGSVWLLWRAKLESAPAFEDAGDPDGFRPERVDPDDRIMG